MMAKKRIQMRAHFTIQGLTWLPFALYLSACGAAEDQVIQPRVAQVITPTTTTSTTTAGATEINLQSDTVINAGATMPVTLPAPATLDCNHTTVSWTVVSGSGITLGASTSCSITVSAAANFTGEFNLRGETTYNGQRYIFSARLRAPSSCDLHPEIAVGTTVGTICDQAYNYDKTAMTAACAKLGGLLGPDPGLKSWGCGRDNNKWTCIKGPVTCN